MNYKKQISLAASALTPLFFVYFGYKYTVFHGNIFASHFILLYLYLTIFILAVINHLNFMSIVDTGHGAIVFNKIYGVKS